MLPTGRTGYVSGFGTGSGVGEHPLPGQGSVYDERLQQMVRERDATIAQLQSQLQMAGATTVVRNDAAQLQPPVEASAAGDSASAFDRTLFRSPSLEVSQTFSTDFHSPPRPRGRVAGWLHALSYNGSEGLDEVTAKKVIRSNQVAVVMFAAGLPWLAVFAWLGFIWTSLASVPWLASFFLALYLNRTNRHHLGRVWLVLSSYAIVFLYCVLYGEASGMHWSWIPGICIPLVFLDNNRKKEMAALCLVDVLCFFLLRYIYGHYEPIVPLDQSASAIVLPVSYIMCFLLNLAWMVIPIRENASAERQLRNALEAVHEKQAERDAAVAARAVAEAQTAFRSNFLATMSHEIRTPLNGILGLNQLMLETTLDAEQRDMSESIGQLGTALLAIIGDILDYSKIEAGKLQLESVAFDPEEAMEEVLSSLYATLDRTKKQIDVLSETTPGMPRLVMGDRLRLQQVLFNFLSNGLKFSRTKGHVVLRGSVVSLDQHTAVLRFEVEDTGIGVSQEAKQKLFKPFTQAEQSTTRKYGGTGLGLTICRQLVLLMGGEVGLESEVGRGSTFWCTIPFKLPPPSFAAGTGPSTSVSMASLPSSVFSSPAIPRAARASVSSSLSLSGSDSTPNSHHSSGFAEPDPSVLRGLRCLALKPTEPIRRMLHLYVVKHFHAELVFVDTPAQLAQRLSVPGHGYRLVLVDLESLAANNLVSATEQALAGHLPVLALRAPLGRAGRHPAGAAASALRLDRVFYVTKPVRRVALLTAMVHAVSPGVSNLPPLNPEPPRPTPASAASPHPSALTASPSTSSTAAPFVPVKEGRILVAEDNQMNQKLMHKLLTKFGYAHEIVEDGERAVDAFNSGQFDLILMDCSMPVMDGFDATRRIRQIETESSARRRVPIIALTASAFEQDRERCRQAGMSDFLSKPISLSLLEETVDAWLAKERSGA